MPPLPRPPRLERRIRSRGRGFTPAADVLGPGPPPPPAPPTPPPTPPIQPTPPGWSAFGPPAGSPGVGAFSTPAPYLTYMPGLLGPLPPGSNIPPSSMSFPSVPGIPTPPGGGGPSTEEINWGEGYEVPGAPEWWVGLTPDQETEQSSYASMVNAMIPFMSPEDQRTAAASLALMYPDDFGIYNPENIEFGTIPDEVTGEIRNLYLSSNRAERGLDSLSRMYSAISGEAYESPFSAESPWTGLTDFNIPIIGGSTPTTPPPPPPPAGPSYPTTTPPSNGGGGGGGHEPPGFGEESMRVYNYLRQVLDALSDFGGSIDDPVGRQDFLQRMGALDPLMAQSQEGPLAPYGSLVSMLVNPYFTAGPLMNVSQQNGEYRFGSPNQRLF